MSGSPGMAALLNIEIAGVSLGLVASMGVSLGLTAGTIRGRGTLAQKKRWLPELVTFEKVGAWAITEPDSGSDAFGGMKTTVRRDGDDYILNGRRPSSPTARMPTSSSSTPSWMTATQRSTDGTARFSRSYWTRGWRVSRRVRRSRRWV